MEDAIRFQVEAEASGQRLDEFLAARLPRLSRLRLAHLLAEGRCSSGQVVRRAGHHVSVGEEIELMLPPEVSPGAMAPEALPLRIVFEDEQLIVVEKAAGMLVHPTRGVKSGTLANALAYHLNRERLASQSSASEAATGKIGYDVAEPGDFIRPGLVHRLDRATSGLLVVAKTQRALSLLSKHFHRRLVEKRYLALLHRRVEEDTRVIEAPVGRDEESRPQWRVLDGGKPAETRLRVLERTGDQTLVELEPVTGRTNQLRIHCAHIGHPIVGDEWYGSHAPVRLCLHAARLAFHHPAGDNRWMDFTSPLPPEIVQVMKM